MKNLIIVAVVALVVGGVVGYFLVPANLGGAIKGRPINTIYDFTQGVYGKRMVKSGAITAKTASATLTPAEVCNSGVITDSTATTKNTLTLPTATLLNGSCLTTDGDSIIVPVLNTDTATGTLIAVGSGGTLDFVASSTIDYGEGAILQIIRTSASAYQVFMDNIDN
jgi:hypothetical protein